MASRTQHGVTQIPILKRDRCEAHGHSTEKRQRIEPGFTLNPYHQMHIQSLPIIENLSIQILSTLAQGEQTMRIVKQPESEPGQAYGTLRSLFEASKKIYSSDEKFLSADDLNMESRIQRATIRITNLATFVSSVFGGSGVSFYELNDNFVDIFTHSQKPLQIEPGQLLLDLKTQIYTSAVSQPVKGGMREDLQLFISPFGTSTKAELLGYLFPHDMDGLLLSRHPKTELSSSELEFMAAFKIRQQYLLKTPSDVVIQQYTWEAFLLCLSAHLGDQYSSLITPPGIHATPVAPQKTQRFEVSLDEFSKLAEAAVQKAVRDMEVSSTYSYSAPQNCIVQSDSRKANNNESTTRTVQYPTRSAATVELDQKARNAVSSKQRLEAPMAKNTVLSSQRRPWTGDEERCLMAALDAVKGPHWSQILALHGEFGTMSRILKDRNQVQLKDKARNLKLSFLKTESEVPYHLQNVTGELRTRAPSQAARKEAEEKARAESAEEKAKFNSIMILAGGLQSKSNGSIPATNAVRS